MFKHLTSKSKFKLILLLHQNRENDESNKRTSRIKLEIKEGLRLVNEKNRL